MSSSSTNLYLAVDNAIERLRERFNYFYIASSLYMEAHDSAYPLGWISSRARFDEFLAQDISRDPIIDIERRLLVVHHDTLKTTAARYFVKIHEIGPRYLKSISRIGASECVAKGFPASNDVDAFFKSSKNVFGSMRLEANRVADTDNLEFLWLDHSTILAGRVSHAKSVLYRMNEAVDLAGRIIESERNARNSRIAIGVAILAAILSMVPFVVEKVEKGKLEPRPQTTIPSAR